MITFKIRTAALCLLLATTSAAPALAQVKHDMTDPPAIITASSTGVNFHSGAFTYTSDDLSGGALTFTRRYTSGTQFTSGKRWTHNFDMYIYDTVLEIIEGEKPSNYEYQTHVVTGLSTVNFQRHGSNPSGTYSSIDDINAWGSTLTYASGKFTFTDKSGTVYTFMTASPQTTDRRKYVVEKIEHPDGTRLDFAYVNSTQVKTVTTNRGDALVFDHDANGVTAVCYFDRTSHYVTTASICTGASNKASYSYSASSVVTTSAGGETTEFVLGSRGVTCIKQPAGGPCKVSNAYNGVDTTCYRNDQVTSQTLATGVTFSYVYARGNPTGAEACSYLGNDQTTMTQAGVGATVVKFVHQGLAASTPSEIRDPLNRATLFTFEGASPKAHIYPEGNSVDHSYDARMNKIETRWKAKAASGLADITKSASFPLSCSNRKTCNKPDYIIDERGNRTDYTYDPNHGGVLTETGPAVNGVRPQKRFTYAQRYAWIKNSAGGYSKAATPVWLLVKESTCKTGAASGNGCAIAGDEVVTEYDYGPDSGPNNLLLRGTVVDPGGLNLRTCFAYDNQGNKIAETAPKAGLASCQ